VTSHLPFGYVEEKNSANAKIVITTLTKVKRGRYKIKNNENGLKSFAFSVIHFISDENWIKLVPSNRMISPLHHT